jgi:hypothetical protein
MNTVLLPANEMKDIYLLNALYKIVVYSTTPLVEGTCPSHCTLNACDDRSFHHSLLQATEPSPKEQYIQTIPRLADEPSIDLSIRYIKSILSLDISTIDKLYSNLFVHLPDAPKKEEFSSYFSMYNRCYELLSRSNLFISFVNGGHRAVAAQLALCYHQQHLTSALDMSTFPNFTTPFFFKLTSFINTDEFVVHMQNESADMMMGNELFIKHHLYDEYLLCRHFTKGPTSKFAMEFQYSKFILDHANLILKHFEKHGYFKLVFNTGSVGSNVLASPEIENFPQQISLFQYTLKTTSSDNHLHSGIFSDTQLQSNKIHQLKIFTFLSMVESVITSKNPTLTLRGVYQKLTTHLGHDESLFTHLIVVFGYLASIAMILQDKHWYLKFQTKYQPQTNKKWTDKFKLYVLLTHLWEDFCHFVLQHIDDAFFLALTNLISNSNRCPSCGNNFDRQLKKQCTSVAFYLGVCAEILNNISVADTPSSLKDFTLDSKFFGTLGSIKKNESNLFVVMNTVILSYQFPSDIGTHLTQCSDVDLSLHPQLQSMEGVSQPMRTDDAQNRSQGIDTLSEGLAEHTSEHSSPQEPMQGVTQHTSSSSLDKSDEGAQEPSKQGTLRSERFTEQLSQRSDLEEEIDTTTSRITNEDRGTGGEDETPQQEEQHDMKSDKTDATSILPTETKGRRKSRNVDEDLNFFDQDLSPESTNRQTRSNTTSQNITRTANVPSQTSTTTTDAAADTQHSPVTTNRSTRSNNTSRNTTRNTSMHSQTTTTTTNATADTLSKSTPTHKRSTGVKRKRSSPSINASTSIQPYDGMDDDEEEDDYQSSHSSAESSSDDRSHLVEVIPKKTNSKKSKNSEMPLNKYKDPVKIYQPPTFIQEAIHDYDDPPPKLLEWINSNDPFLFRDPTHIPPIHSDSIDDVISGKAFIHISSPIDITIPGTNGTSISFTDIRNEWEVVKDNIAYVNAIPTGWGNDSVPDPIHRRRSSRLYLKEDKFVHAPKNRFQLLPTMVNKARTVLSNYCNASLKETDPPYVLRQSSIIFDDGRYPHIQKPHTDFHTDNIRQQKPPQEPLSVLYAIDSFSVIIFPRGRGEIGGNTGTRVLVPKGCSLWFTYRLWHSGDIYIVTDECPYNARIHFFAIQDYIFQLGGMHDNLVDRRMERDDLLHQAVDLVNVLDINDLDGEFQRIQDETETFGNSAMVDNRLQVVFCNLLLLYDFLGITMESCNKLESADEQKKIKEMHKYAHTSYIVHMKEMWGILTRLHPKKEIEINVLGENNEITKIK